MIEHDSNPDVGLRLLAPLSRLAGTLKRRIVIEGLCAIAAAAVAVVALEMLLDRLLNLGLGPRAAILVLLVGTGVYQVYRRVLKPMQMRVSLVDVAALVERRNPDLRDSLISAVSFSTMDRVDARSNSPELIAVLRDRAIERARTVRFGDLLRNRRHLRFVAAGIAAVAASAAFSFAASDTLAVYVQRNFLLQDVPWPSNVHMVLEGFQDGVLRHPMGDELRLVATATGEVPSNVRAEFESSGGETIDRLMERRGTRQFTVNYGPLSQPMRVRLLVERIGADESTIWHRVDVIERPGVRAVQIESTPPAYTHLPPYQFATGQTLGDALRGATLRITADLNKPVAQAVLQSGAHDVATVEFESPTRITARFMPTRTATYQFALTDAEGLSDLRRVSYAIRVVADPPPRVRLSLPGCGEMIVSNAVIGVDVDAEDNLGMQSLDLLSAVVASGDSTTQPAVVSNGTEAVPKFVSEQTRFEGRYDWPVQPLGVHPGDRLTLQIRARDYQPKGEDIHSEDVTVEEPPGPSQAPVPANQGLSAAYTLRVVTREELLAELGRREQEWRREFEQIVAAQEQLNKRVMDLRDRATNGSAAIETAVGYAREERMQRQQASRMKAVRTQFSQLLAEQVTNQVATSAVRRRLGKGVVAPLDRLIQEDVVQAADQMERLRRRFDPAIADQLEQMQAGIVQTMQEILANMLKWEGYNEAVALLQDIVRLQENVNEQTQKQMQREIDRLFGEDQGGDGKGE